MNQSDFDQLNLIEQLNYTWEKGTPAQILNRGEQGFYMLYKMNEGHGVAVLYPKYSSQALKVLYIRDINSGINDLQDI